MIVPAPLFNPDANRVFFDCDGVLADFDGYFEKCFYEHPKNFEDRFGEKVFWHAIKLQGDFFSNLPLLDGAVEFYQIVASWLKAPPILLTGCSEKYFIESVSQKHEWVRRLFGKDVPLITCQSKNKRLFARPGDVIIDDWDKYQKVWEDAGGHWVLHRSIGQSLVELKELGVIGDLCHAKQAA